MNDKAMEIIRELGNFFSYYRTGTVVIQNLEDASQWKPSETGKGGTIRYDYGIGFSLAGRANKHKIIVALEPNDTYTVYVWRPATVKEAGIGVVLEKVEDVYADNLYSVLERRYRQYVDGVVPAQIL